MDKILIAEDDFLIRKLISASFAGNDLDFEFAANGLIALKKLENNHYDLLVTDIFMPKMNGLELIDKAKELDEDLPIIAMTSLGDKDIVVELLRKGVEDYLEKPFDSNLLETIKKVLKKNENRKSKKDRRFSDFNQKVQSFQDKYDEAEVSLQNAVASYKKLLDLDFSHFKVKTGFKFMPVSWLGGDFADAKEFDDKIVFFIADVAGHDMGASYYAVMLKMLFEEYQTDDNPEDFLLKINEKLIKTAKFERMITAQICVLLFNEEKLIIYNSGHPAPMILNNHEIFSPDLSGSNMLGIFNEPTTKKFTTTFKKGFRLFCYTDGLLETSLKDSSGCKIYLIEKELEFLINNYQNLNINECVRNIFEDIYKISNYKQQDDMMLLGIEF